MYLDINPRLEIHSPTCMKLITDRASFRFQFVGESSLMIMGSFGTSIYSMNKMSWKVVKDIANAPFEYFVEKCVCSPFGRDWMILN